MRILIDTNIFFYRKDNRVVPSKIGKLMKQLENPGVQILIHPESEKDIERDGNKQRKQIMHSKLETYEKLKHPPNSDENQDFLNKAGKPSDPNEKVDNDLLYAIFRNSVDFLVTEDGGIHRKAEILNLDDQVLYPSDAADMLRSRFEEPDISRPPALKKVPMYNLNLEDPFFDSLKEEYPDFEDWFREKSREGRNSWVYRYEDGGIGALLIYKEEKESIGTNPQLPSKERMKLCTFKVGHQGRKIGELFIRLAVDYAKSKDLREIYLTHYSKKEKADYLKRLITEYGFEIKSTNERGEDVYVKELLPDRKELKELDSSEVPQKYWPNFKDGREIDKFIVPIRPKWHDRLFTNYERRQTTLQEHSGEFIPEGNTIKKAYLSNSKITQMSPGDIILFYRSEDQRLTTLGTVENLHRTEDSKEIQRKVGRRTVYTEEEIEAKSEKETLVILFRWHLHLNNPLSLKELTEEEVLNGPPQSITEIEHENYLKVKEEGNIDERFTVS